MPCVLNLEYAFCSSTSGSLEKGQKWAERKKEEDGAVRATKGFKGLQLTELISDGEVRRFLTDGEANETG